MRLAHFIRMGFDALMFLALAVLAGVLIGGGL